MSDTLSFPGLGLEFPLDPVAFNLFGLDVYWYGILIAAAFLLGTLLVMRRAGLFGLDSERTMDLLFLCVLSGIVGARLYYVLFTWEDYKDNLLHIFNLRMGGLAIYGGVIFGALAAFLLAKPLKIKLLPALDLLVGGLMLGQAIGRWGNFTNIEAFGSNTSLPWGMTSPSIVSYLTQKKHQLAAIGMYVDPQMPVHPTFLYESIWCLLGFAFLMWFTKRRRFDGEMTLIYFAWYGLGRFFIEGLRTDPLLIGTVRVSQLVALFCVLASVLALAILRSRIRREGDPEFMALYVNTSESRELLEELARSRKKGKEKEKEAEAEALEQDPEDNPVDEPAQPESIEQEGAAQSRGGDPQEQKEDHDNGKTD